MKPVCALLLGAIVSACGTVPTLAPITMGWRSMEGPDEEILFRRVSTDLNSAGNEAITVTSERRVLRRARTVMAQVAIDPDRKVLSAEARIIDQRAGALSVKNHLLCPLGQHIAILNLKRFHISSMKPHPPNRGDP